MKKHHINSFVWLYDAKYLLRVEIQIVALVMEMSSKTNKKDCCQRTLILKAKSTTIAMENVERPCAVPHL
jgi:hypothetical protein